MYFYIPRVFLFIIPIFFLYFTIPNFTYASNNGFSIAITSDVIKNAVEEYKKGNWLVAESFLREALEEEPDREDLIVLMSSVIGSRAFFEYENGNMEEAKILFLDASGWKENQEFFLSLAVISIKQKNLEDSEKYFSEVNKSDKNRTELYKDVYKGLGNEHYKRGNTAKALEFFEQAVKFDSKDKDLLEKIEKLRLTNKEEKDYVEKVGSHFTVRYEGGENAVVGHIVSIVLEEAYLVVGAGLGFYPESIISAVVYSDKKFSDVTNTPDWAGGLYDGRISIPAKGVKSRTKDLEEIIFHEYTHAIVQIIGEGTTPTWINEGLAQYMEGRRGKEIELDLAKIYKKNKLSLKELEGSFLGLRGDTVNAVYGISLSVTEYIINNYGAFAVKDIIQEVREGATGEEALDSIIGLDYSELERSWLRSVAR